MSLRRGIIENIKNYLFPVFCLQCQKEGQWWCEKCIDALENVGVFYCPVCHLKNSSGTPCQRCQSATALNGVAAFFDYNEKAIVGQLIRQFKYNFAYDIVDVWKEIIDKYLLKIIEVQKINAGIFMVIPVSLHRSRYRRRGFNQAELIAELLYTKLKEIYPLTSFEKNSLIREKPTKQQAKLNRADRLKNLQNAFGWQSTYPPSKNIILVDDVYTSGATMQECAKILKRAGAQKVFGLTLARD